MRNFLFSIGCFAALALFAGCAAHHAGASAAAAPPAALSTPHSLVAHGQARFKVCKCGECHGPHGEGTDDAPDLIGTRLNAGEILQFLQKPSAHARSVGMPAIPAESPDLKPLVAFVLSLKRFPAMR